MKLTTEQQTEMKTLRSKLEMYAMLGRSYWWPEVKAMRIRFIELIAIGLN